MVLASSALTALHHATTLIGILNECALIIADGCHTQSLQNAINRKSYLMPTHGSRVGRNRLAQEDPSCRVALLMRALSGHGAEFPFDRRHKPLISK